MGVLATAGVIGNKYKHFILLAQAENILLDELPIIPMSYLITRRMMCFAPLRC